MRLGKEQVSSKRDCPASHAFQVGRFLQRCYTRPKAQGVSSVQHNSASHDLSCDICGTLMIEQNCKIRCPNCGYTRDCSDP